MAKSRNLIIVGSIVLILIVLVLVRSLDQGHFRTDLGKLGELSLGEQNLVNKNGLAKMDKPLLILLENTKSNVYKGEIIEVSVKDITQRKQFNEIINYNGPKVLISENVGISAKTWMILSQMGVENLYLLDEESNEGFKYEFEADTITNQ